MLYSSLIRVTNYFGDEITTTTSNNDSGGSGGGAGGEVIVLTGTNKYPVRPGTRYSIIVGAGGIRGIGARFSESNGSPGEDSSFDIITSFGGSGGACSRNMSQNQNTDKNGKGGNGGQNNNNLFGGGGGGQNSSNNYGLYNSGGPGASGYDINFDGNGYKIYGAGGDGGKPNTVTTETTLANIGKGGKGTGATINSYASGVNGGSGIVIIKYYT
jgi:hypothetical protein